MFIQYFSCLKKEVDIGSFHFLPKWEKTRYLDYTYPVSVNNLRFMMPYPEQEQESYRFMAIFRPMNLLVYASFLIQTILNIKPKYCCYKGLVDFGIDHFMLGCIHKFLSTVSRQKLV